MERKQESGSEFQDGRWGGYGERESSSGVTAGKAKKWARESRGEICCL